MPIETYFKNTVFLYYSCSDLEIYKNSCSIFFYCYFDLHVLDLLISLQDSELEQLLPLLATWKQYLLKKV